jgi:hypothetical protein
MSEEMCLGMRDDVVGLEFLDSAPSFADTAVQDTEAVDSTEVRSATPVPSNMVAVPQWLTALIRGDVKLLISRRPEGEVNSTEPARLLAARTMADSPARLFCLWISLPLLELPEDLNRSIAPPDCASASLRLRAVRYTKSAWPKQSP